MSSPSRASTRWLVFLTLRQPNDAASLSRIRTAPTPLPENRYVGSNYGRYMNPAFDQLIETYFVTIPRAERLEILRQIMHHISDQVTMMGLFYDADIMFIANRLQNVTATTVHPVGRPQVGRAVARGFSSSPCRR